MTDLAKLIEGARAASERRLAAAQQAAKALSPEERARFLEWLAGCVEADTTPPPANADELTVRRSMAAQKAAQTRKASSTTPTIREVIKLVLANGDALTIAEIRAAAAKIRPDIRPESLAAEVTDMRDHRHEVVHGGTAPNGHKRYALAPNVELPMT